jgi:hypothetical protein
MLWTALKYKHPMSFWCTRKTKGVCKVNINQQNYNLKMKKSFILMLFSVLLSSFCLAQTAVVTETGCTSIRVALSGACSNAYIGWGYQTNGTWYYQYFQKYTYKLTLVKVVGGNNQSVQGSWINTDTYDFTNLEEGSTYKVLAEPFLCTSEPVQNANGSGGYRGVWGSEFESNSVIVGASRLADNSWKFIEIPRIYIGNYPERGPFYEANEPVKINASASKNYDIYAIAIQEFYPDEVTQGRWRPINNNGNGGWTTGQIGSGQMGIVDLSVEWARDRGWTFLTGYSYRVQVVIQKNSCPSWTQVLKFFRVCENATGGCRIGGEKSDKMTISPNPASNKFQLMGIDFSADKNYKVSISDISGKEIQAFEHVNSNEFSTENLANGIYIVNLMADNRRLFSSKLIVSK